MRKRRGQNGHGKSGAQDTLLYFAKLTRILPRRRIWECCYKSLFLLSPSPQAMLIALIQECTGGSGGRGGGGENASFWRASAFASQGEPFANKRRTKELKAPLLSKMVSKSWLDLGWDRPRIKLFWVLPRGNFTGIWLQKDKLKVMQPEWKGKFLTKELHG